MLNHCETCRHWNRDTYTTELWGTCYKGEWVNEVGTDDRWDDDGYPDNPKVLAYVEVERHLKTHATFGCVLFERRT